MKACLTALLAPPQGAKAYLSEPEDCDCQEPCATSRQHEAKVLERQEWGRRRAFEHAREMGWL